MALNKKARYETESDVIEVISPEDTEDIVMGFDPSKVQHLLARLTDAYTKPIEATVRETVSNGVDATRRAGSTEPVEINLPSTFSPTLFVTDKGVGMSREDVKDVFSQYLASTKEDDMNQTGAFGLGAKAPLSYCTEFSVSTTKDGITTNFNVARKAAGNVVRIISSVETNAASGTTVTIPVKDSDVQEFAQAVAVYKKFSFNVPVAVDGEVFVNKNYVKLRKEFVLDVESNTVGSVWVNKENITEVVMNALDNKNSRVMYPTGHSFVLSGWLYTNPIDSYYRNSFEPPVIVELKPGVVDFSTSRDEITKNERVRTLNDLIKEYFEDTDSIREDFIQAYKNLSVEEAKEVFYGLSKSGFLGINEDGSAFYRHNRRLIASSDSVIFEQDDFKHGSFDPLETFRKNYKQQVLTAFINTDNGKPQYLRMPTNKNIEEYTTELAAEADFESTNISELNKFTSELVAFNKPFFSLSEIIDNHAVPDYSRNSSINYVFVTNSTPEKFKKLLNSRSILTKKGGFRNSLFAIIDPKAKLDFESVYDFVDEKTKIVDIDELIQTAKDLRKVNRKNRISEGKNRISVREITEDGFAKDLDVVNHIVSRGPIKSINITAEEIKAENGLLVFYEGNNFAVKNAVIGAANFGIDITNRPVYALSRRDSRSNICAEDFKELLSYDGVIVEQNYSYKSKAAEQLIKENTYFGEILNSQLNKLKFNDVVYSVLSNESQPGFHELFSDFLSSNHNDDINLKKATSLLSLGHTELLEKVNGDILNMYSAQTISRSKAELSLTKEEVDSIYALKDVLHSLRGYQENTDNSVISTFVNSFRNYVKPKSTIISNAILEEIYNRYLDKKDASAT